MMSWREVVLHFGKHKDVALGQLPQQYLTWLISKWQPQGWQNEQGQQMQPSKKDKDLRAWLDQANEELQVQQAPPLDPNRNSPESRRASQPASKPSSPSGQPKAPQMGTGAAKTPISGGNLTFEQACELWEACLLHVTCVFRKIQDPISSPEAAASGAATLFIYLSQRGIMPKPSVKQPRPSQSARPTEPSGEENQDESDHIPFVYKRKNYTSGHRHHKNPVRFKVH